MSKNPIENGSPTAEEVKPANHGNGVGSQPTNEASLRTIRDFGKAEVSKNRRQIESAGYIRQNVLRILAVVVALSAVPVAYMAGHSKTFR